MSELFTPHEINTPNSQSCTSEQAIEESYADAYALQDDEAYQNEAARRAKESVFVLPTAADTNSKKEGWTTGQKIGAGIGLTVAAAGGIGGGIAAYDHFGPHEVVAEASSTIQQGEGVEQAVDRSLGFLEAKGVDPADATNRQDVISQAVSLTSENGVVQPGQTVSVEAEKSPLGNISYKAVETDNQDLTAPDTH